MAFREERTEGERLCGRPIDSLAGLDRLAAGVEKALDGAVNMKALWHHGDFRAHVPERFKFNAGVAAPRIVQCIRNVFESGPATVEPVGLVGLITLARLQLDVEPRAPVAFHL